MCLQAYAGKEVKLVQRFQGLAMLNAVLQISSVSLGSQCLSFSFSATRVFVASMFVNAYWQPKLAIWCPETHLVTETPRPTGQPCGSRLTPLLPWTLPLLKAMATSESISCTFAAGQYHECVLGTANRCKRPLTQSTTITILPLNSI